MAQSQTIKELSSIFARVISLSDTTEFWNIPRVDLEYNTLEYKDLYKLDPESIIDYVEMLRSELDCNKIENSILQRQIEPEFDRSNPFDEKVIRDANSIKTELVQSAKDEIKQHLLRLNQIEVSCQKLIEISKLSNKVVTGKRIKLSLNKTEIKVLVTGLLDSAIIQTDEKIKKADIYRFFAQHFVDENNDTFSPKTLMNSKTKTVPIKSSIEKLNHLINTIEDTFGKDVNQRKSN